MIKESPSGARDTAYILFGAIVSLCITGYQFGRGNHTVYLLEGLRLSDPTLFTRDWFVTSTLQYHALFGKLTYLLIRTGLLEQVFLAAYLAITLLWHFAWLSATLSLGGSRLTYALSVILYHVSAGGVSLGVYQFLQDSCFLPSNVANVALFVGILYWCRGSIVVAGGWFGIAGIFHMNHAAMGVGLWCLLILLKCFDARSFAAIRTRTIVVSSLLALVPSCINLSYALRMKLAHPDSMPLAEFVEVYVRFRHSHHFDPLAWPIGLWIAFLWPIPLAVFMFRRNLATTAPMRQWSRILWIILALQLVSLLGAGIWWISESLVQLMFWRFSIYVKLLSCIAAAWVICDARILSQRIRVSILALMPIALVLSLLILLNIQTDSTTIALIQEMLRQHLGAIALFSILSAVPLVCCVVRAPDNLWRIAIPVLIVIGIASWNRALGLGMTPERVDTPYLEVCDWARANSPLDAVFLVPPEETAFRLEARRAIVVNFKHVPQLNAEIILWFRRVKDVVGIDRLNNLPRQYVPMLHELRRRYEARPVDELIAVAQKYGANYIVVGHALNSPILDLAFSNDAYFVYHLAPKQ